MYEMINKYSGRYREKLKKIGEPLFQTFGINYFYYLYLSSDNRASFLGTKADLIEDYLDQNMQSYNPLFKQAHSLPDGICLYDSVDHEQFQESMNYLQAKYDTKHCCILKKQDQEGGVGLYGFSVPQKRKSCDALLINQIPLLRAFTHYFEEEMGRTLLAMRQDAVEFSYENSLTQLPCTDLDEEVIVAFLRKISRIDAALGNAKFTKRDQECIELLLTGKTAKAIAQKLHLSRRTVEHRLDLLKDKLDCCTKSELIEKLQKFRSLSSF